MSNKNSYQVMTNIYRTEKYVVCQDVFVETSLEQGCCIVSKDTYKKRDYKTDKKYLDLFKDREDIEGKRIRTNMYKRRYLD